LFGSVDKDVREGGTGGEDSVAMRDSLRNNTTTAGETTGGDTARRSDVDQPNTRH